MHRRHRFVRLMTAVAVATGVVAAAGIGTAGAQKTKQLSSATINGSGSTFVQGYVAAALPGQARDLGPPAEELGCLLHAHHVRVEVADDPGQGRHVVAQAVQVPGQDSHLDRHGADRTQRGRCNARRVR